MINSAIRYGLFFILLLLLQVLLFNNIQFTGFVNPYVYIMFILVLPADMPAWLLLSISFATGAVIDIFSGTPGMHSSATLLTGFLRPSVLRIISARDFSEQGTGPSMHTNGLRWFLIYTIIMVLIHHTTLFYLEVFRLTDFFRTFLRVILSSFFTIIFILLLEYYRKRK